MAPKCAAYYKLSKTMRENGFVQVGNEWVRADDVEAEASQPPANASKPAAKTPARRTSTKKRSKSARKSRSNGNDDDSTYASDEEFVNGENGTDSEEDDLDSEEDSPKLRKAPPKRKSTALKELEEAIAISANKKARKGTKTETTRKIYNILREQGWKKIKFANSAKQKIAATTIILDLMELEEFTGDDEETQELRKAWIEENHSDVVKQLNKTRSYAQTEVIKALKQWQRGHEGQLPSLEDLERCLKREIDLDNPADVELFEWYSTVLLRKACANASDWTDEHYLFLCLYNGAPPNDPNNFYVPPSTEGIAVAMVENNRSKLTEFWRLLAMPEHAGILKVVPKVKIVVEDDGKTPKWTYEIDSKKKTQLNVNGKQFLGQYSIVDGGQMEESGWTKEGRQAFMNWTNMAKEARACVNKRKIEDDFLEKLREANDITEKSWEQQKALKRKKAKKAKVSADDEDEVEMDYE